MLVHPRQQPPSAESRRFFLQPGAIYPLFDTHGDGHLDGESVERAMDAVVLPVTVAAERCYAAAAGAALDKKAAKAMPATMKYALWDVLEVPVKRRCAFEWAEDRKQVGEQYRSIRGAGAGARRQLGGCCLDNLGSDDFDSNDACACDASLALSAIGIFPGAKCCLMVTVLCVGRTGGLSRLGGRRFSWKNTRISLASHGRGYVKKYRAAISAANKCSNWTNPSLSRAQVGPAEWRVSWEQFEPSRRKFFPEMESVTEK